MEKKEEGLATALPVLVVAIMSPSVSKAAAAATAKQLEADIKDGKADELTVWERLTYLEAVAEAFKSDHMKARVAALTNERGEGMGKVITTSGVFATRAVGTKYDFGTDVQWNDLNNALEAIKEAKAQREAFLKALVGPIRVKYRGEECEVIPAPRISKDGFSYTLNKE